jgi:hypothetical protein
MNHGGHNSGNHQNDQGEIVQGSNEVRAAGLDRGLWRGVAAECFLSLLNRGGGDTL